jgi:transposase-like protein
MAHQTDDPPCRSRTFRTTRPRGPIWKIFAADSERVCPHCGTVNESFATKKPGVYRCRSKGCRKDFSVTTKSVMESSHIKLNVWLQAFFLMASSKKGMSSHQLRRALGVTYKTAWFLSHRIREAMRVGGLMPPMGGAGKVVEADETFIGRLEGQPKGKNGYAHKNVVLTLVERGGSARSFHIDNASVASIVPIIREKIVRETDLMTDEARHTSTSAPSLPATARCAAKGIRARQHQHQHG